MSASSDYRYDPVDGPRDRSLRVGDKERDAVGEILRQRHVEGRLDADEFGDRLDRCLKAKTYAELDALIADFPSENAERRRSVRRPTPRSSPLPFLILPLVLIGAIAAGAHLAWVAVPLFFFFVVRPLALGARGYGSPRGASGCGARRATRA